MASHFNFEPAARDKDVLAELEKWNKDVTGEDRERKYSKMICGEFPFFRGTNHLQDALYLSDHDFVS